jgi:hypothetical protein
MNGVVKAGVVVHGTSGARGRDGVVTARGRDGVVTFGAKAEAGVVALGMLGVAKDGLVLVALHGGLGVAKAIGARGKVTGARAKECQACQACQEPSPGAATEVAGTAKEADERRGNAGSDSKLAVVDLLGEAVVDLLVLVADDSSGTAVEVAAMATNMVVAAVVASLVTTRYQVVVVLMAAVVVVVVVVVVEEEEAAMEVEATWQVSLVAATLSRALMEVGAHGEVVAVNAEERKNVIVAVTMTEEREEAGTEDVIVIEAMAVIAGVIVIMVGVRIGTRGRGAMMGMGEMTGPKRPRMATKLGAAFFPG